MNIAVTRHNGAVDRYTDVTHDLDSIGILRIFDADTELIAAYSPHGWMMGTYSDNPPADSAGGR